MNKKITKKEAEVLNVFKEHDVVLEEKALINDIVKGNRLSFYIVGFVIGLIVGCVSTIIIVLL